MKGLTIGKVARKAGVGIETIRFYERRGIIEKPPKPPENGFRIYSEEIVHRILFIRQAQELGFSLKEIGELLDLKTDPKSDCSHVRERADAKLVEVEQKLARLKRIRSSLRKIRDACPGSGNLKVCSILDALKKEK